MGYKIALHLAISEGYVHTCRISKTQQFYISTVHTTHVRTYVHTYTELSTHQSCWQHERKGPSRTIHTCTYVRTYVCTLQHLTFCRLDDSLLDEFVPVSSERQLAVKVYSGRHEGTCNMRWTIMYVHLHLRMYIYSHTFHCNHN